MSDNEQSYSKLTVITPSYNQAQFIESTIQSILSQKTDFPVEYLVLDGGSTDGTLDILKKYEEKLKWISQPDGGQADAVNKGIGLATGDIVGWLNSDDIYLPGTLQSVVNAFDQHPESHWLYGKCNMINETGREVRKWITKYKNFSLRKFSYNRLLTENYISQPAVFFRKKSFLEIGELDTSLHYAMDYDLWLKLGRLSPPVIIHRYLASFRLHGSSKSVTNHRKLFSEQYDIHRRYNQGKVSLFRHRLNIAKILFIYGILEKLRTIGNMRPVRNT